MNYAKYILGLFILGVLGRWFEETHHLVGWTSCLVLIAYLSYELARLIRKDTYGK